MRLRRFELATLALYQLGGAVRAIDTEDAAIKCHELAPQVFSWRKYPDQVNLELARVSLSDAKKSQNGQLVSGSGRTGWRLTHKGVEWSEFAVSQDPNHENDLSARTAGSVDSVRRDRELKRVEQSAAWAEWTSSRDVLDKSARELLRIDSYTSPHLLQIKIARLASYVTGDSNKQAFLEALVRVLQIQGNIHD